MELECVSSCANVNCSSRETGTVDCVLLSTAVQVILAQKTPMWMLRQKLGLVHSSCIFIQHLLTNCTLFAKKITLVNKYFAKCLIVVNSYAFFGAECEYDLRICPNGFIFCNGHTFLKLCINCSKHPFLQLFQNNFYIIPFQ
jgi:hypothetical protein